MVEEVTKKLIYYIYQNLIFDKNLPNKAKDFPVYVDLRKYLPLFTKVLIY
jgi:hypothetical protein